MSCTSRLRMRVLAPQGVFIPMYLASDQHDFSPNENQVQVLLNTMSYLPAEHLRRFSGALGHMRASGRQCTPLRGGARIRRLGFASARVLSRIR